MADQQNTLQGKSVMPSLTVNNLKESLAFFTALGFEPQAPWEVHGVMLGAMLTAGDARLPRRLVPPPQLSCSG